MKKFNITAHVISALFIFSLIFIASMTPAHAETLDGNAIQIPVLNVALGSVIKTIQVFALVIMVFSAVIQGVRMIVSFDNNTVLSEIKTWSIRTLVGSGLVLGATIIPDLATQIFQIK